MKMHKIVFFNSMILGTLISISAYSWFSMWMGLEINLLSFIPLMTNSKNSLSSESSMKYFITQAMASMILLMAVVLMLLTIEFSSPQANSMLLLMMNSALLTKLGAAPFHFWLPEVIEGLSWFNSLIMLTWQKIAPMMLLMNNSINPKFLMVIMLASLMISTISGFNQISLRKIMAFSSINHIAWMLSTLMISTSLWLVYFIIYTLINFNLIAMFNTTKSFFIFQMNNAMTKNKMTKLSFMINFMSLGGLPPFIGFMPKWMVINWLTNNKMMAMAFIMIITTLIMLFVYMRIMMSSIMMNTTEIKKTKIENKSKTTSMINFTTLASLILCTMVFNFL